MTRRSHPVPRGSTPPRSVLIGLAAAMLVGCTANDAPAGPSTGRSASSSALGASGSTSAAGVGGTDGSGDSGAGDGAVDGGARLDTGGTLIRLRQTPDVASPTAGREVAAILTDLETFWSRQLRGAFTAPRGGYLLTDTADLDAATSTSTGTSTSAASASGTVPTTTSAPSTPLPTSPPTAPSTPPSAGPTADYGCAGSADALRGNAFYCPGDDAIVIDAGALVPVLRSSYGIGGLATALAHEYGHLVQARIGPTSAQQRADPQRYPQVLIEAQADCAAGAYLAWASGRGTASGTSRLQLPVSALSRSISPLVDFRDSATAATTDLFHGYGLDRLRAVVRGYQQGTKSCAAMTADDLDLTLGRPGTGAPSAEPRYPSSAAVAAAAAAALGSFDPAATGVRAPPAAADLAVAQEIGQFAAGSALVLAAGRQRFPAAPDCYLGAFTAARYGHAPTDTLGAWRSDADEAMDLVIARATGSAAGWSEITGFVRGFGGGLAACR